MTPAEAKKEFNRDMLKVVQNLERLKLDPDTTGDILESAAPVLREHLIYHYMKADPTGLGGNIGVRLITKRGRKRPDLVYIGPDWMGENDWLWNVLQWGSVSRMTKGERVAKKGINKGNKIGRGKPHSTGVMPAFRFLDKAIQTGASEFLREAEKAYDKIIGKKIK